MDFTENNGTFTCDDLKGLPHVFEQMYTSAQVAKAVDGYIALFRGMSEKKFETKEDHDATPESERISLGQTTFDSVVAKLKIETAELGLFETFLFWFGLWWYYNPELTMEVHFSNRDAFKKVEKETLKEFLLPILPKQILVSVQGMEVASVANGHGHFAILFVDKQKEVRRIITDTQLFELHGVSGYVYLDVTKEGKPIARSCCDRDGGRNFFDGVRLMSHEKFQTCAPSTVMIDGGYKVNSTKCTIVNGQLFNLIDFDDKVAQTNGAFLGMVGFTSRDAANAVLLAKQSGTQMRVSDGVVTLGDKEIKPIGMFTPSKVSLLDTGFALYEFSDFHEIESVQYDTVLVVDDKKEWIESVVATFGGVVRELQTFQTTSANDALARILDVNPSVVLLDMHLTAEERFDGLWIANELSSRDFKGAIMIASSYGEEALRAMQVLIKVQTIPTGKDLKKIQQALYGKPVR